MISLLFHFSVAGIVEFIQGLPQFFESGPILVDSFLLFRRLKLGKVAAVEGFREDVGLPELDDVWHQIAFSDSYNGPKSPSLDPNVTRT